MQLGKFSLSLAVKNIEVSKQFYEKLGFKVIKGDVAHHWLVLKNEDCAVALIQGHLEKNTLTFIPGLDSNSQPLASFTDVRDLQRELRAKGVSFEVEADESKKGPTHFIVLDPDGNPILVDQHS